MILQFVRRARLRYLRNEIVAQGVYAASTAFGAVILLLLLGTQILEWHWLVVLPLGTLGVGIYRTWKRLPSLYRVAQLIDSRLALADTLSTALFFAAARSPGNVSEPVRIAQRAHAERLSETVNLKHAIPLRIPRATYAMGLLGLVASSLFALRYGLDRKLDLRPPLARIIQEAFGLGDQQQQAARTKEREKAPEKRPTRQDEIGLYTAGSNPKSPGELDAAPDSALDTVGVPDVDNSKSVQTKGQPNAKTPGAEPLEGEEEGEAAENAQASGGAERSSEGQQGPGQGKSGQPSANSQAGGVPGDNSSLLNKFREAMSNLLSRMRQHPSGAGAQQRAGTGQNGSPGKGQQANSGQRGRQGQHQTSGQESDSQDGQGEEAQNAQNAQGRGFGQSAEAQASRQPGSGIGKQDGSKDVKLAEQLAAMGKISEIIGKRSANVTGEVIVEVQNSNQQLRTPYSQASAQHGEAGGEISRDEVPVVLQPYVQQYFEQVRKQAGEAPARGEAAGPKSAPRRGDRETPRNSDPPKAPSD